MTNEQPISGMRNLKAQPADIAFDSKTSAVLVVDMQNDFGSSGGMFDRAGIPIAGIRAVVPNIATALEAARAAGLRIVYIKMGFRPDLSDMGAADAPNRLRHDGLGVGQVARNADGREWRILVRDGWGTDVVDALKPSPDDAEVWKNRYSGFYQTDLDAILKSADIKHLFVTGCTTSICVDSTVRDAFYRDYHCVLLRDCMAEPIASDAPRSNHDATLLAVELLFGWTCNSSEFLAALEQRPPQHGTSS